MKQDYVGICTSTVLAFRSHWPVMFLDRRWPACCGPTHGLMQRKSTRPGLGHAVLRDMVMCPDSLFHSLPPSFYRLPSFYRKALLAAFADVCLRKVSCFNGPGLARVAWAFATLGRTESFSAPRRSQAPSRHRGPGPSPSPSQLRRSLCSFG